MARHEGSVGLHDPCCCRWSRLPDLASHKTFTLMHPRGSVDSNVLSFCIIWHGFAASVEILRFVLPEMSLLLLWDRKGTDSFLEREPVTLPRLDRYRTFARWTTFFNRPDWHTEFFVWGDRYFVHDWKGMESFPEGVCHSVLIVQVLKVVFYVLKNCMWWLLSSWSLKATDTLPIGVCCVQLFNDKKSPESCQ